MFGGGIAFDAPAAEMRFDAVYLELPVVRDDAALRRMLQKPISLDGAAIPSGPAAVAADQGLHRRTTAAASRHAGAIAEHLNISVRSLQRHLQEEGTTVLALHLPARRVRAEDLLRRGDLPLKRVASLVGYGDEVELRAGLPQLDRPDPGRISAQHAPHLRACLGANRNRLSAERGRGSVPGCKSDRDIRYSRSAMARNHDQSAAGIAA